MTLKALMLPMVMIAALITSAAAYRSTGTEGVFWTRTEVAFLHPADELSPNSLRTTSQDLVVTAGIVGKRVSGPGRVTKYASPDVDLVGVGIRDGWWVRLPDTGGQWSRNFESQQLVVEVVGSDADRVKQKRDDLVAQIAAELHDLQLDAGVATDDLITIRAPDEPGTSYVGGSRLRALGMTVLLGFGTTATVVILLASRLRARSRADWIRFAESKMIAPASSDRERISGH